MSELKTVRIIVNPLIATPPPPEKPVAITINGVTQEVPVGVETEVREDMLEALTNSDRTFTIVDPPAPDQSDAMAGAGSGAAGVSAPGASAGQENTPAARSGPDDLHDPHVDKDTTGFHYEPVTGAFGAESAGGDPVPETPLTPEDQVEQQESEAQEQSTLTGGGETEQGSEGEQDGGTAGATGSTFSADEMIDGNISLVTQRLPNLTSEQLDQVLAAERDREQPRKGVLEAVDAAKKALAEKA